MPHILLVEDDESIIKSLSEFLVTEGFSVASASGRTEALQRLANNIFDIILLDISLTEGNGFEICSAVKNAYNIPVIFLTARDDEGSVVAGLDMGADDYISKPFRPRELVSRIHNVLRRFGGSRSVVRVEDITVDTDKGCVMRNGTEIPLSALEYRILLVFISNRGILLSRTKLLEEIWDIAGDYVNDNTLTVYIKRIREKIENDPQNPQIIKTIRGLGYRLD